MNDTVNIVWICLKTQVQHFALFTLEVIRFFRVILSNWNSLDLKSCFFLKVKQSMFINYKFNSKSNFKNSNFKFSNGLFTNFMSHYTFTQLIYQQTTFVSGFLSATTGKIACRQSNMFIKIFYFIKWYNLFKQSQFRCAANKVLSQKIRADKTSKTETIKTKHFSFFLEKLDKFGKSLPQFQTKEGIHSEKTIF